jgi:protein SCO1/2
MERMGGMTRRKWLATMGSVPLVAGVGALAARGRGLFGGDTPPRFQPVAASGPQSARALLQQRHLPNLPLVTHDGKTVRFYDDLVKDKKVIITFIDTQTQPQTQKVTQNLATLQRFFGSRVGNDIHMYSITSNPHHDTPAVLNSWAAQHGAGPGWVFLTGRPADVETLRHSLGFASKDPAEDANPAYSIGVLRHGVEPEMRWAHCQSQALPRVLAHSMLLDFGTDPADPNPPPIWNCTKLTAGIA